MAVEGNNVEVVKLLLSHPKIDINSSSLLNFDGNDVSEEETALHLAVKNEKIEIIKLLLNHEDIDVHSKNNDDETPIELTENDDIKALFK